MISVLDASVALKWQFEDEEVTGAATALLCGCLVPNGTETY